MLFSESARSKCLARIPSATIVGAHIRKLLDQFLLFAWRGFLHQRAVIYMSASRRPPAPIQAVSVNMCH